jgi:hypothetical protein
MIDGGLQRDRQDAEDLKNEEMKVIESRRYNPLIKEASILRPISFLPGKLWLVSA